jgi:hypothetical protein
VLFVLAECGEAIYGKKGKAILYQSIARIQIEMKSKGG